MAELVVRDIEPAVVARLKQRADEHRRSVEDEHRAILCDALMAGGQEMTAISFEAYLRKMPDVGTDADFSRIEGSLRDIDLAE